MPAFSCVAHHPTQSPTWPCTAAAASFFIFGYFCAQLTALAVVACRLRFCVNRCFQFFSSFLSSVDVRPHTSFVCGVTPQAHLSVKLPVPCHVTLLVVRISSPAAALHRDFRHNPRSSRFCRAGCVSAGFVPFCASRSSLNPSGYLSPSVLAQMAPRLTPSAADLRACSRPM
ncbi:hypothetical protein TRVL_07300 [Trypanosoma vivax]|nr:hypothetical protein TRVL_07300 [Trypanosoma vivax]